MTWRKNARDIGVFKRDYVDLINRRLASQSDRYLYAHLEHKRVKALAAEFKDSRPMMTTEGFGPEKFAQVKVARRAKR